MTIEYPARTEISGKTRLLAIVGDPIEQVKSPIFYNRALASAGTDAVLVPWHAPAEMFETVMTGLLETANLDGIVITYPFKQRACAFADELLPMASRLGAVNVLRREGDGRWVGEMYDGFGLVEAARRLGVDIKGARIQLLGAGGAGSAIAYAVAAEGAASLAIVENDEARLNDLVQGLKAEHPDCDIETGRADLGNVTLLVNATPVGLQAGDGLPVAIDGLSDRTAVIDIVPGRETELLQKAAAIGCRALGGSAMVEGQAELVLRFLNKIGG